MGDWSRDDLETIGRLDEIEVSSCRPDGSLRPFVTIWAVTLADEIYVRSAYGPDNGWFRRAKDAGAGALRFDSTERTVTFEEADASLGDALHDAYRAKYGRYPADILGTVISDTAAVCTLRVRPR